MSLETLDLTQVTLAVLAGGQSRRMGSNKAHLQIAGKPILRYLLDRWNWPGQKLLVTAPSAPHPPGHELFDGEFADAVEGQGPLRGVLTAAENCRTSLLIVATLDMPCIDRAQLEWFAGRLSSQAQLNGLMLQRDSSGQTPIEPFPFVCRAGAKDAIAALLQSGKRSMRDLLDLPGFSAESAPDEWAISVWTNLNSPDEYLAFLAAIAPNA